MINIGAHFIHQPILVLSISMIWCTFHPSTNTCPIHEHDFWHILSSSNICPLNNQDLVHILTIYQHLSYKWSRFSAHFIYLPTLALYMIKIWCLFHTYTNTCPINNQDLVHILSIYHHLSYTWLKYGAYSFHQTRLVLYMIKIWCLFHTSEIWCTFHPSTNTCAIHN